MTEQSRMRGMSAIGVSFTTWPLRGLHWVGRDRVAALLTPVIRLFATRSKRRDFSLQFQGSQSDLWRLFSHPLHHKLRNYSRRFFCVIRAGEPALRPFGIPILSEAVGSAFPSPTPDGTRGTGPVKPRPPPPPATAASMKPHTPLLTPDRPKKPHDGAQGR